MLIIQQLSYTHSNKELLFSNINLSVKPAEKVSIIGNNGVGKSTLLKIISGELQPTSGHLILDSSFIYIPQIFGQFNHLTIAEALKIDKKLNALNEILKGNTSEDQFIALDDDWTIEERSKEALEFWKLDSFHFSNKLDQLSGGQKMKVFLASIQIHQPEYVLLDEPTNHLDLETRNMIHEFISNSKSAIIVVSHDKKLLNLLEKTYEMSNSGLQLFGGNYDFYKEQKQIQEASLNQSIHSKERELKVAKEKQRETIERQNKLDAKGKQKQEKSGVARIMMNTLRNNAEKSTSKLKGVHTEKIDQLSESLHDLKNLRPDFDKIKFSFETASIIKNKVLVKLENINFRYENQNQLWKESFNFSIISGNRYLIKGRNGIGKSTLIQLILGDLKPSSGTFIRTENLQSFYIDQDYSLINSNLTVYEQAQKFNTHFLEDHEIKTRLTHFLFFKDKWDVLCENLSGGEKIKLLLCGLTITQNAPDLIVLDEPTNNLDIQNIELLTKAIQKYNGTLLVVSHDEYFVESLNIQEEIFLK